MCVYKMHRYMARVSGVLVNMFSDPATNSSPRFTNVNLIAYGACNTVYTIFSKTSIRC